MTTNLAIDIFMTALVMGSRDGHSFDDIIWRTICYRQSIASQAMQTPTSGFAKSERGLSKSSIRRQRRFPTLAPYREHNRRYPHAQCETPSHGGKGVSHKIYSRPLGLF